MNVITDIITPLHRFIGKPVRDLIPQHDKFRLHKGFTGRLVENILGASSSNQALPDLPEWGIEIKTLPVSVKGLPLENTFINKISLPFKETLFEESMLWLKIKKILWVPVIGSRQTPMLEKIIGYPILWEPDTATVAFLKRDWQEITTYIRLGDFNQLNSQLGELLHVRPKAADASKKIYLKINGYDQSILPIGFYFRKALTQTIIESNYAF